jgi:hypothetical protein
MILRPRIFHFGACDLWDSLHSPSVIRRYDLAGGNVLINKYPPHGTSLMSLYAQPSSMAERMFTYMKEQYPEHPHESFLYDQAYVELTKFPYYKFLKENVVSTDIMVINFSNELYTRFITKNECFSLVPQFHKLLDVDWVNKDIISKTQCYFDFDTEEVMGRTKELLVDFAVQMKQLFQDRIILVKTKLASKCYISKQKIVPYTINLKENIPFYHNYRFMNDPKNGPYVLRWLDVMVQHFKRKHGSDLPVVELDDQFVYMDPRHRWGVSPIHLTAETNAILATKILEQIDKMKIDKYTILQA